MDTYQPWARKLRLRRLSRPGDNRLFVVPLDHSVTDGPLPSRLPFERLIERLVMSGVDAVVVHKGKLHQVDHGWFAHASLIIQLNASTRRAPDPDAKVLVTSVEEALRLSADAVSMHVNLGSNSEAQQLADLARVADACDRWRLPLLAMMYPRGPAITDPHDPELIAHAATVAADLGADLVKTVFTGSVATMAEVVRACPVPLLMAGGPKRPDSAAALEAVRDALAAGMAGVAMGRNVFDAPDPGAMAKQIAALVHPLEPDVRGTAPVGALEARMSA